MPGLPPNGQAEAAAIKRYLPFAQQAGFKGQSLLQIMAIAFAESGFNPAAQNTVNDPGQPDDGSVDRGILQINSHWHPEVADACAYDPACSFKEAWRISQQGQNFWEWNTFKNKVPNYQLGLKDVQQVLGGQPITDTGATAAAHTPGTAGDLVGVAGGIVNDTVLAAIKAAFQPLFDALPSFGLHIALFFGALMLVIVGLWILTRDPVSDSGSTFNAGLNKLAGGDA